MSVLLTHGYFLAEDEKEQKIMKPYPPLGLLYVSAFLKKNQIENEIFDSTFKRFDDLTNELIEKQPKIIAIYTNLMTKLNVLKIIRFIHKHSLLKDSKVVLGGPDLRYNIENYLNSGADFLIIGEGEQTAHHLFATLLNNHNDFSQIKGIAYKNDDNQIIENNPVEKIKDLSTLPLPNRQSIDLNRYLDTWKKHHGYSSINISTQRGCPYTCKWCSTAVYGQSYRRRKAESVVAELKELQEKYNPDSFWFVDDVFTVSHKWLDDFKSELDKQNVSINFECITRADRLNPDVVSLMSEIGCKRIWIGAESGSQNVIDLMDRRVDVNHVREMIRLCKSQGIETGTFIMLGYPGEKREDIKETIKHLKQSKPDAFTITIAYPIKGTELYKEIEQRMDAIDWNTSTDREIQFKRDYSPQYYRYALSWVVNDVNSMYLSSKPLHFLKAKSKAQVARFISYIFQLS